MGIDKKLILEKADIVTVIGKRVQLKKEGKNYVGRCPFHNEKTGSFSVSSVKNIYKCFGCGRSGDVIAFIEQFEHLEFNEAIERLATELNIIDPAEPKKVYELPEGRPDDLSDEFMTYLVEVRKISIDTIIKLRITGSIEWLSKAKKKIPVICFNFYHKGVLKNIKFRGAEKQMQLITGAELIPYNVDAIKNNDEACITEGEIDCATLVACHINNSVSAPNGAAGNTDWSVGHFDKKTKIILFTDDDEPGRKLRDKLTKRLGYHRCFWVDYPDGLKDINEVLTMLGSDAVKKVYENAYAASVPTVDESVTQLELVEDPDESLTIRWVLASGKMSFKINLPGILKWAREMGYCWIRYAANEDSPVMLIRVYDNVIYPTTEQDILSELKKEIDLNYSFDNTERVLLYNFAKSFQRELVLLPYFDGNILCDEKDCAYLCFTNGVLKIKRESFDLIAYSDIGRFVWSKYIIPHEYVTSESAGDFDAFLRAISIDADHYLSILSHLGYLLHSYKLRTTAKAVIIVEDVEDESEARGRSGKGLMAQFIELFKNTVQQDGRNYKTDDKFKLQRVDISTQIFYINDPAPGLLMNQFYNMITDDFLVEGKGKKSYTIPFKKSAKILVTTNHLPPLTSDSDRDRFAIISIKKTFGSKEQISERFPGVLFFDTEHWSKNEFQAVFQLAVEALQVWFTGGLISFSTPEMDANRSKRLLGTVVPEYVSETLDQVIPLAKRAADLEYFNKGLIPINMDGFDTFLISKVFDWQPGQLTIHLSYFYRYCLSAYKAKTSQVWFGRNVRFYLEHSKSDFEEIRSNDVGRRILVKYDRKNGLIRPLIGLIEPQK